MFTELYMPSVYQNMVFSLTQFANTINKILFHAITVSSMIVILVYHLKFIVFLCIST